MYITQKKKKMDANIVCYDSAKLYDGDKYMHCGILYMTDRLLNAFCRLYWLQYKLILECIVDV